MADRPPPWRRRRFWQVVIVVEIALAVLVSVVAEDRQDGVRTGRAPLPIVTDSGT